MQVHIVLKLCWNFHLNWHCIQFSSVAQSCLTLCDPMDCSTADFPVHHQIVELAQIHDAIESVMPSKPLSQWCHPNHQILGHPFLLLPSIFPNIGVFPNESALRIMCPKYWPSIQHQSFQWISLQLNKLCLKNLIKVDFISWVFNSILMAIPADGREIWMIQSILTEGALSQPDLRRSRLEEIPCEIRAACWCFRGSHAASADIINPTDHTQWPSLLWQQST